MKASTELKYLVIVFSFLAIIIGYSVNPQRTSPTIPSFPSFIYVEHLFGPFAMGIIPFSVLYLILFLVNKREQYNNAFSSFVFGLLVTLPLSITYEIFVEKAGTIKQFPFDLIGIAGYILYIKWAYLKKRK